MPAGKTGAALTATAASKSSCPEGALTAPTGMLGTSAGMVTCMAAGAVLGPGSNWLWRISEKACWRLTVEAEWDRPSTGGAEERRVSNESFSTGTAC